MNTNKTIEELKKSILDEFNILTRDEHELDLEYYEAGNWLRTNPNLFTEGLYDEPMLTLSREKIQEFIERKLDLALPAIKNAIYKEVREMVEKVISKHNARILNEFQDQGTAEMPFIAYDERICLIPAIKKAMEETEKDILSLLKPKE